MTTAFALDTSNDISLDALGRIVLTDSNALLAQRLKTRLRWHRGEWALDTTQGVDYMGTVLVKNPNIEVVRALILAVIAGTEGVDTVSALEVRLGTNRQLVVTFMVNGNTTITENL